MAPKRGREPLPRDELLLIFGRSNPFKEGDAAICVAATSDAERREAREALGLLRIGDLTSTAFVDDEVSAIIDTAVEHQAASKVADWTVEDLKHFLLTASGDAIKEVSRGLTSEAIAAPVKLMSEGELTAVAAKVFNPPAGSTFGAPGYLGSRIQPNSPTDDPEEILISVLEGLSYGCGDVVLGINPVDSDWRNIARLERTLRDVVRTFELHDATTYCVLGHIDDQMAAQDNAAVDRLEASAPVDVGFQSIGGTAATNATFNLDNSKLLRHLKRLRRQYFETGQGSEVTNNCAQGVDMVTLEARSYGLARALMLKTGNWTIINDVAGFIGPEVFSNAEQLKRACLEDLVMGKLHGLPMGLDICSTFHMGVSIEDLDAIMDEVMAAGPAYLMGVAGKSDPMLSYITTSYRDHARLRSVHGLRVSDTMERFFARIGVMEADGLGRTMTCHAGDTAHVYIHYRRAKGDTRPEADIRAEVKAKLDLFQARGLDLGYGHDGKFEPPLQVKEALVRNYEDAKRVLFAELDASFLDCSRAESHTVLHTKARTRNEFLEKPALGEVLCDESTTRLARTALGDAEVVLVLSDGLNAKSVMHEQCQVFVGSLRRHLHALGIRVAPGLVVVNRGRVRASYEVGRVLFSKAALPDDQLCATVHIVGERPGNGKNTFSAYIAVTRAREWRKGVNHDVTRVVSGISISATHPIDAADQSVVILRTGLRPSASA